MRPVAEDAALIALDRVVNVQTAFNLIVEPVRLDARYTLPGLAPAQERIVFIKPSAEKRRGVDEIAVEQCRIFSQFSRNWVGFHKVYFGYSKPYIFPFKIAELPSG